MAGGEGVCLGVAVTARDSRLDPLIARWELRPPGQVQFESLHSTR